MDVVCRPIKLNNFRHEPPKRIVELEKKSSQGATVVIQHILPTFFDFNGRLRNIGLYATETSQFSASVWSERINAMDEAWVINDQMLQASRDSGVTVPITVIPHATNTERFMRNYGPCPQYTKKPDTFVFYTIGEKVRRKNLQALIKAFHIEFGPNEPVELVIKTSVSGKSAADAMTETFGFCQGIKEGMKLHDSLSEYKQEVILTERMTDEEICGLHASCDCFVQSSYGEAWSIPAFDAMGFGKTPIVTDWGGYRGYMTEDTGWLVKSRQEPVFGMTESFADLYTSYETWASVEITHLQFCMRQAYEDHKERNRKAVAGISRAFDFSYEAVGSQMLAALTG